MIKNKRGLSGIITAVILIALVMTVAVIVWVVVTNMVQGELGGTESCFGTYGKVTLNNRYTCYNFTSNSFQFSIDLGDVDVDSVIALVSGGGTTKSYTITNEEQIITNVANYPFDPLNGFAIDSIKLPGKNGGLTYLENASKTKPDLIKLIPVINNKQCEAFDSLSSIDDCASLA